MKRRRETGITASVDEFSEWNSGFSEVGDFSEVSVRVFPG